MVFCILFDLDALQAAQPYPLKAGQVLVLHGPEARPEAVLEGALVAVSVGEGNMAVPGQFAVDEGTAGHGLVGVLLGVDVLLAVFEFVLGPVAFNNRVVCKLAISMSFVVLPLPLI